MEDPHSELTLNQRFVATFELFVAAMSLFHFSFCSRREHLAVWGPSRHQYKELPPSVGSSADCQALGARRRPLSQATPEVFTVNAAHP
jgi:hypothetical protein